MLERKAGSVRLHRLGRRGGQPRRRKQADYVIAKTALVALARSIAVDHGAEGIRANVVAPGFTESGISLAMPEKARMVARMQTPVRRLTEPTTLPPSSRSC